jgi:hypothetical protein
MEGPVFSSSRIVRWSDCSEAERDAFARFFAEHNVSFFQDADGSFAANVRLYDKDVLGQRGAGAGAGPAGAAGAKKVRRARGCGGASSASARPLRVSPSAGLT